MARWLELKTIGRRRPAPVAGATPPGAAFDRALHRLIEGAVFLPIFLAPWFLGGCHPLGQCVLTICALVAVSGLAIRGWRRGSPAAWTLTPAHALLFAAIGVALLQLTPLPGGLLRWLSPSLEGMLPLWSGGEEGWPRWSTISLAPAATRGGLEMMLAYAGLFAVALQHLDSVERIDRAVRLVAVAATIVAIGSLAQRVFGERHLLGIYEYPGSAAGGFCGPFLQPGHCLHFLALGMGPLVWLTFAAIRANREARRSSGPKAAGDVAATGWRLWWLALAVGVALAAAWLGGSLVGLAMNSLAMLVAAAALRRAKVVSRRSLGVVGAVAAVLMLAGLAREYAAKSAADQSRLELALDPYERPAPAPSPSADLKMLHDFWPLGAGLNLFDELAPCYCRTSRLLSRPEATNDYLRLAVDTGLAGLALLAAAVAWIGWRCYGVMRMPGVSPRVAGCLAAALAGLVASVAHAAFDCVWRTPASMAMTVLLAACAVRLADIKLPASTRVWRFEARRGFALLASLAVVAAGMWTTQERGRAALAAPHWDAFRRAAIADLDARAQMPDRLVAEQLRTILLYTPDDADAHLQLAAALLEKIPEMTDQARRAKFIAWGLERASSAVSLSPLLGEGYVYLAELQRCRAKSCDDPRALMCQALRVRPHSSDVLLAAGAERAAAGDLDQAVIHWREAFRSGRDEQNRLAPMLVENHVPVDVILEEFEPDLDATRLLAAKYTSRLSDQDAQTLLKYYLESAQAATKTVSSEGAASLWIEIEDIYERMGKPGEALRCLRRAAAARPSDLTLRTALAKRLFREHEFAEAEMHFKWRLQRSPDDAQIQAMLAETQRMLKLESTTAGVPRPATR